MRTILGNRRVARLRGARRWSGRRGTDGVYVVRRGTYTVRITAVATTGQRETATLTTRRL